jgi:hypothetical protein
VVQQLWHATRGALEGLCAGTAPLKKKKKKIKKYPAISMLVIGCLLNDPLSAGLLQHH